MGLGLAPGRRWPAWSIEWLLGSSCVQGSPGPRGRPHHSLFALLSQRIPRATSASSLLVPQSRPLPPTPSPVRPVHGDSVLSKPTRFVSARPGPLPSPPARGASAEQTHLCRRAFARAVPSFLGCYSSAHVSLSQRGPLLHLPLPLPRLKSSHPTVHSRSLQG